MHILKTAHRQILSTVLCVSLMMAALPNIYAEDQAQRSPAKKLYIAQFTNHPALDQTRQGILDALNKAGYIINQNLEYKFESAEGSLGRSDQIAKNFVTERPDCLIAIGTPIGQSLAIESKNTNIPLVFSSVTDPLSDKMIDNLFSTNKNITGVSNFIELGEQIALFKKITPNLTKLGFIYNINEANSSKILMNLETIASQYNIQIISSVATKTTEIAEATEKLIGNVDAILISNDNTALAAFSTIAHIAREHQIPVYVSDIDIVNKGAIAALGPDQYEIGEQTGQIAAKILNGTKAKDIPVEFPKKQLLAINAKLAKELSIKIPQNLLAKASKVLN